jgi:GNAT superfamily N-acetyltransferase
MTVKEYESARTFLEDYEAILLEREAVSQLVLYNAYQSRKNELPNAGIYGAVLDGEEAVLLFCNLMPHNLVVYVAKPENTAQAAAALADFMGESRIIIKGMNARNDVCLCFMEQYKKHISCVFTEKLGMDIMEIRRVNDVKPVEGTQRPAMPEEAKLIADWMIEFQLESLANEMDYETILMKAVRYIEDKRIFLFENNEKQVTSMAVAARKLVHGIALTYVYTPEEYRGIGYAAANIYYLSKYLLEQGYEFCTLFVDRKNPFTSRAYEKVGFVALEDNYEYGVIAAEA